MPTVHCSESDGRGPAQPGCLNALAHASLQCVCVIPSERTCHHSVCCETDRCHLQTDANFEGLYFFTVGQIYEKILERELIAIRHIVFKF